MKKLKVITYLLISIFAFSCIASINAETTSSCWEKVLPPSDYGNLGFCSLVYDSESDLSLAFEFDAESSVYAYEANENTWIKTPTDMPEHLHAIGAVGDYHEILDAVIFFGGSMDIFDPDLSSNQTWAYFYNNNSWVNLNATNPPPPRIVQPTVYDSFHKKIVIFFGANDFSEDNFFYEDIWSYDYLSNAWTNVTPEVSPVGCHNPGVVYDSDAKKILIFGGAAVAHTSYASQYHNQTWEFDLATSTWTELLPKGTVPTKRGYVTLAYDQSVKKTVLFGGTTYKFSTPEGEKFSETYVYDYPENKWTKLDCLTHPSARILPGLAFNSKLNNTLLFGGLQLDDDPKDTWIFTYEETDDGHFYFISSVVSLVILGIMIIRKRKKN